jgi:hypothetical protein
MGRLVREPKQPEPPLPDDQTRALLDHLNASLSEQGGDDTPRITIAWLNQNDHPTQAILAWLRNRGGYCDCEIVAKALEEWEDD